MPAWKKGESGNPNGRPSKNRALTAILEKAGDSKKVYGNGVVPKKYVAEMLWQAAATGTVTFAGGETKKIGVEDWFGVVKFIYSHIDGPPKQEMEHEGEIVIRVKYGDGGTDSPTTESPSETA